MFGLAIDRNKLKYKQIRKAKHIFFNLHYYGLPSKLSTSDLIKLDTL